MRRNLGGTRAMTTTPPGTGADRPLHDSAATPEAPPPSSSRPSARPTEPAGTHAGRRARGFLFGIAVAIIPALIVVLVGYRVHGGGGGFGWESVVDFDATMAAYVTVAILLAGGIVGAVFGGPSSSGDQPDFAMRTVGVALAFVIVGAGAVALAIIFAPVPGVSDPDTGTSLGTAVMLLLVLGLGMLIGLCIYGLPAMLVAIPAAYAWGRAMQSADRVEARDPRRGRVVDITLAAVVGLVLIGVVGHSTTRASDVEVIARAIPILEQHRVAWLRDAPKCRYVRSPEVTHRDRCGWKVKRDEEAYPNPSGDPARAAAVASVILDDVRAATDDRGRHLKTARVTWADDGTLMNGYFELSPRGTYRYRRGMTAMPGRWAPLGDGWWVRQPPDPWID